MNILIPFYEVIISSTHTSILLRYFIQLQSILLSAYEHSISIITNHTRDSPETLSCDNIEIQIDTATSEVHLIHDSSKQSHIVDDCESDVEMPSTRPTKNLEGFDRGQTERDELEIHLNATLSEASQLAKEQRRE